MSWSNFYKNRVNSSYLEYAEKRYNLMIDKIVEYIPETGTAVEAGCGIGTISKLVKKRHNKVFIFAFDNDLEMIKLADTNLNGSDILLAQRDILTFSGPVFRVGENEDKRSDVAFSHGVLEHFSDDEIRTIISNQKQYARNIVHYVPTSKYKVPSFGDERLLSMDEWIDITNPKQAILFNDNYDLLLVF